MAHQGSPVPQNPSPGLMVTAETHHPEGAAPSSDPSAPLVPPHPCGEKKEQSPPEPPPAAHLQGCQSHDSVRLCIGTLVAPQTKHDFFMCLLYGRP